MKKIITIHCLFASIFLFPFFSFSQSNSGLKPEEVSGDPMQVKIYTLKNGLKVYMSVYKDAPRVQTMIAVRAGSKNDPPTATGLAHYLEHMLFKGTDKYGTQDYAKEETELNKIEDLYETYRATTDEKERKRIYHRIDSISGVAARYAIANEYDKMTAALGCSGTNAFTSFDQTVYINDVPSNQLENWLSLEAERFRKPVLRIFHTELEAVYEEKNISLDSDQDKVWDALFSSMFKNHTYGTQTTIGTIEHLKNPSIKEIKKYYSANYVPNNMAIILSGDFDPEKVIESISQKFSYMESKPVSPYTFQPELPIASPVVKEVFGPEMESVNLAYRFNGAGTADADMIRVIAALLYNDKAGLLDINLNKAQRLISSSAGDYTMKDYAGLFLDGYPKEGQTLEEVKELLLAQINELKKGNFQDWMLKAVITKIKLEKIRQLQSNYGRAGEMMDAFVNGTPWSYKVTEMDRLSRITREQVIDFVNKNMNQNYVVVFKRTGEDKNVVKVDKPEITPVEVNREQQSDFLKQLVNTKPTEINPVFIDYEKDIVKGKLRNGLPVHYTVNKEDQTFQLYYRYDIGRATDNVWPVAIEYLKYLGTNKYSADEVAREFFKIGCSFDVQCSEQRIVVSLSGLQENFSQGLSLLEHVLQRVVPDEKVLKNLVEDMLKMRQDQKLDKDVILRSALMNYARYGKKNPFSDVLTEAQLRKLQGKDLVKQITSLNNYEMQVLYYGPATLPEVVSGIEKNHSMKKPTAVPAQKEYSPQSSGGKVYVVDFEMKQADVMMLAGGEKYDPASTAEYSLYNEYFGGGMSSIVFQELRESKALAYSTYSVFSSPDKKDKEYVNYAFIGTQSDKLSEAMSGMMQLLREMPRSTVQFEAAKSSSLQKMKTSRITKSGILMDYESARRMGWEKNIRPETLSKLEKMELKDVVQFHENRVKGLKYTTLVVGKKSDLDESVLKKYGEVEYLTLEEIFGF